MQVTLILEKLKSDFKYDNTFFKFQAKNTKIRDFGPKFRHIFPARNYAILQIRGL